MLCVVGRSTDAVGEIGGQTMSESMGLVIFIIGLKACFWMIDGIDLGLYLLRSQALISSTMNESRPAPTLFWQAFMS